MILYSQYYLMINLEHTSVDFMHFFSGLFVQPNTPHVIIFVGFFVQKYMGSLYYELYTGNLNYNPLQVRFGEILNLITTL